MTDLNHSDKIDLEKTLGAQLTPKKIIRKYKNLKRKGGPLKISARKGKEEEIIFIWQKPLHLRDRLRRLTNLRIQNEDVKFIQTVPLHLRDRLNRLTNTKNKSKMLNLLKRFLFTLEKG